MGAAPRSAPKKGKLSRKERATEKARNAGYIWAMCPSDVTGYKYEKLVKLWNEPPMPVDVLALVNLLKSPDFMYWWDPFSRSWNFCRKRFRFQRGYLFHSVPYNAGIRRWQHELSKLEPSEPLR